MTFQAPLLLLAGLASAPEMAETKEDIEQSERTLASADQKVPTNFAIFEDPDIGFIKPVIQISASALGFAPESNTQEDLLGFRMSTMLIGRLGFEGKLWDILTFRSVFERNLGFRLFGGPKGTSVWEGTGSFQARENYLKLEKWGFSLVGGIFPDPASVDFISTASLDLFGMDPYVRDPLLVSGFNQSQGMMLRWGYDFGTAGKFDIGVSASGGNPLTSSLSFGFRGAVSALGTLYSAPLRSLSGGYPGSDIHMYILSPSLTYSVGDAGFGVDFKAALQAYDVDVDVNARNDKRLSGYNFRSTMRVRFLEMFSAFGTFAYRQNQQTQVPQVDVYADDDAWAVVGAGGLEWAWNNLVVGGQYYFVETVVAPAEDATESMDATPTRGQLDEYLTVGVSYFIEAPNLAIGLRYSRSMQDIYSTEEENEILPLTQTAIFSIRLVI